MSCNGDHSNLGENAVAWHVSVPDHNFAFDYLTSGKSGSAANPYEAEKL